jgi:hypothetical protein
MTDDRRRLIGVDHGPSDRSRVVDPSRTGSGGAEVEPQVVGCGPDAAVHRLEPPGAEGVVGM